MLEMNDLLDWIFIPFGIYWFIYLLGGFSLYYFRINNYSFYTRFYLKNRSHMIDVKKDNIKITSKHIKILTECGLIMIKQEGRHRYCEARLDKLNEVSDWVEQYRKFWTQKLDVLEIYLDDLQKVESKKNKKRTINKRKK